MEARIIFMLTADDDPKSKTEKLRFPSSSSHVDDDDDLGTEKGENCLDKLKNVYYIIFGV